MAKPKFAVYWAASCGGCEIAFLDIREKILDFEILYFLQAAFQCLVLCFAGALEFLPGDDIYQVRHGHEFCSQRSCLCFVHIDINQSFIANKIISDNLCHNIAFVQ